MRSTDNARSAPAAASAVADFHGDWVRLNEKWACRFCWVDNRVRCIWNAQKPPTHQQVRKVIDKYETAKREFARQLATRLGAEVLFVDRFGWIGSS